jgi:hypothetical protein
MSASMAGTHLFGDNWSSLRPMRASIGPANRRSMNQNTRTNLAFPSVNWLANATPSGTVDGVTRNIGLGPPGVLLSPTPDAMALIPGSFNGVHEFFANFAGTPATRYTFSVYARNAGNWILRMSLENTGFGANTQVAYFNLAVPEGGIPNQTAGALASIQPVGGNWFRCALTAMTLAGAVAPFVANLQCAQVSPFTNTTGNSVNGTWVWGQQIEVGAPVSGLIPTSAAAQGRSAWMTRPVNPVGGQPMIVSATGLGATGGASVFGDGASGDILLFVGVGAALNGTVRLDFAAGDPPAGANGFSVFADFPVIISAPPGPFNIVWTMPAQPRVSSRPMHIHYEWNISQ